jgi:hypothetical protein
MEIWKDIKGYEGLYQISNQGRVKKLPTLITNSHRSYICKEKIMTCFPDKNGYLIKQLTKNKKKIGIKVHRLVGLHFIENPFNLPQINHEDGIKSNNNDWNLKWCDGFYNQQHARDTGLNTCFAENHPLTKLSNVDVINIRNLKGKIKQIDIARQYKVSPMCISRIINNQSWKRI